MSDMLLHAGLPRTQLLRLRATAAVARDNATQRVSRINVHSVGDLLEWVYLRYGADCVVLLQEVSSWPRGPFDAGWVVRREPGHSTAIAWPSTSTSNSGSFKSS
eukprot:9472214-Pyramimonas_sp.AAC.1